jgi:threonine synthase
MDISKASNFERFVFDLLGRDARRTRELFGREIEQRGAFTLTPAEFACIDGYGFVSGTSAHADRLATIRDAFERWHTLVDTHTADALKVAREHLDSGVPMIVLETALPAKFAATIVQATGREPERPAALRDIEQLPRRFKVMPADAQAVKRYIAEND